MVRPELAWRPRALPWALVGTVKGGGRVFLWVR